MSHCTALLKNYCLGLFKYKKEMKFVRISWAKVFFHQKNVYDNPQNIMEDLCQTIRYWTFVTLYGYYSFLMWWYDDVSHLKMVSYLLQKWYRMTKWYFPIENQHLGVYIKHSDPYCVFLRFFLQSTRGFGLFHQNM